MSEVIINEKYELKELIAESRLYEVHSAIECETGVKVVVKLLQSEMAENMQVVKNFSEEVRMCAGLTHPSLAQIIDFDICDGRPFSVTEFVQGKDLRAFLHEKNSISFLDAGKIVQQLAVLLQYACDQKLEVRTIKPSNIIYTDTGIIKVLSFSLPRLKLIGANTAENAGIQSDLFFLGTMFFELLTGESPIRKRGGINEAWDDKLRQALRIRHSQLSPEQIELVVEFVEHTITRDIKRRFVDHAAFLISLSDLTHTSAAAERSERDKKRLSNASEIVDAINGRILTTSTASNTRQTAVAIQTKNFDGNLQNAASSGFTTVTSQAKLKTASSPATLLCPAENMQLHGNTTQSFKPVLKVLNSANGGNNNPKKDFIKQTWNADEDASIIRYTYMGIGVGGFLFLVFISLLVFW